MSYHRNVHHIKSTSQQTKRPLIDDSCSMIANKFVICIPNPNLVYGYP